MSPGRHTPGPARRRGRRRRRAALLLVSLVALAPARGLHASSAEPDPGTDGAFLARVGEGHALLAADEAADALRLFDGALAIRPDSVPALQGRAAALARLERYGEAREALKRGLSACETCYALRVDLAVLYLAAGNKPWALRTLQPAPPPDSPAELTARRRALLALALADSGRGEEALDLLGPTRDAARGERDGEAPALARIARGKAELAAGEVRRARLSFARVRGSPFPWLDDIAEELVGITLEADRPARPFYAASAAVGVEYDSNALYEPRTGEPTGHGSAAAGRAFVRAALTLRAIDTARHLLAGDASFSRSFHFANENARQLDLTDFSGALRYAFRFVGGDADHTISLRYLFALSWLEGGSLLPDTERFIFLENHSGELGWTVSPADELRTQLTYLFQRRTFAEMARDAWVHQLTFSQTVLLADGAVRLSADLGLRFDDADADRYDLWGVSVGARVAAQLGAGIEGFGGVSYAFRDHYDSVCDFGAPPPEAERQDRVISADLGLGRLFFDGHLSLSLQYRYDRHASTAPTFDYARHRTTFLIGGRL